jgi:predicted dehydrogenase
MAVLLVGLGRWGEQHLRVLRDLDEEVWVADVSPARRAWAVGQGIPPGRVASDYREGLSRVSAVDVVTPVGSHREIAAASLAAGRHCFVEKPLSPTRVEGRELADLARTAGRVLQVGHIFRFHPVTATLAAALREGRIGAVRYATGRFSGFKRPRTDSGITSTDAIHYFDLFAHLLARDATSTMALQRDYLGRGLDDMSVTIVRYGDVPVIVEASYFAPGTHRECLIAGEAGSLVADFRAGTVVFHAQEFARSGEGWEAIDRGRENLPVGGGEPLKLELAAFLSACAGRGPNLVPVEAGLHAVAIVEAAARSSALGRVVSLDEIA